MKNIEEINTEELYKGNEQFNVEKIVLLAEKLNEIIRKINTEK